MTRFLDVRLESSGRFDAIRRLEYVVLLLFAAFGVFVLPTYGSIAAAPLALLALMLVPGKQRSATRESARLQALNDLQQQGLLLKSEWVRLVESPLTALTARQRGEIERKVVVWMSVCNDKLRQFPEVGGIFEAHGLKADIIEELDDCLVILSRLRRLVSLSENLKLPI